MFRFVVLAVLVAVCTAQKSIIDDIKGKALGSIGGVGDFGGLGGVGDLGGLGGVGDLGGLGAVGGLGGLGAVGGLETLPVDVAPLGSAGVLESLGSESIHVPAPAVGIAAPSIHLPKGGLEVVDIPHANIALPGNSIQNKDLLIDLPTPLVEGPKPIIRTKDVLFKLPQPIFYIPKPHVQVKPMVYRLGHALRTNTPHVNVKQYLFQVPSAKITGKSAYSQPIPIGY